MNEVLTVKEIINFLRCDKMTAYKLIWTGKIKTLNIGTEKRPNYRILKEDFEEYLERVRK